MLTTTRALVSLVVAVAVAACAGPGPSPAILGVTIEAGRGSIAVGETLALTATVRSIGTRAGDVTWSTSNGSVATVGAFSGVVTGVGSGTAIITATSTDDVDQSADLVITVVAPMVLSVKAGRWGADPRTVLPVEGTVDVIVDWGDGNRTTATDRMELTHTYAERGVYTVTIAGTLSHFGGGHRTQQPTSGIRGVESWGDLGLVSLAGAFQQAELEFLPADLPPGVTDVSWMFSEAEALASVAQVIAGWDVSNVRTMAGMFHRTGFDADLGAWDVSSVVDMSWMFAESDVARVGIGAWDVSSVTTMSGMFFDALRFDDEIGDWDVSSVTDMSWMFGGAPDAGTSFDRDLSGWDVSSVETMQAMFAHAAFDGDIGAWNVRNVLDMEAMFEGASRFDQDLSAWCVHHIAEEPERFAAGAESWTLPRPSWGSCPGG